MPETYRKHKDKLKMKKLMENFKRFLAEADVEAPEETVLGQIMMTVAATGAASKEEVETNLQTLDLPSGETVDTMLAKLEDAGKIRIHPNGDIIDMTAMEDEGSLAEEKDNPWAICTASVGRSDKAKYEACVKSVKKQKGIAEGDEELEEKKRKKRRKKRKKRSRRGYGGSYMFDTDGGDGGGNGGGGE